MHETVQLERLREMAARRGWLWIPEPGTGFCGRLQAGAQSWWVVGADLGVNPSGAARIARDKGFAQFFLQQAGVPTIPTRMLESSEELQTLREFPLVLKPNSAQGGQGVSRVDSAAELAEAYSIARAVCPLVLSQPYLREREFRVVVFDREPLLAYEKAPLTIRGDGVRSLAQLLSPGLLDDARVQRSLRRAALDPRRILPKDTTFIPLPVANLKAGGSWRECLGELSAHILQGAVAATDALGLTMAGIDLFAETPASDRFIVNEVNAAPGLECLRGVPALLDPLFAAIEAYFAGRQAN